MKRLSSVLAAIIWLPLILGGAPEQPCTIPSTGSIPIPHGYTAHLENPQLAVDAHCVIFAATRPSSGVGGLVWTIDGNGNPHTVLAIDPRKRYALGEFAFDNRGRLLYITVPDPDPDHGGDNTTIDYYLIEEYLP